MQRRSMPPGLKHIAAMSNVLVVTAIPIAVSTM